MLRVALAIAVAQLASLGAYASHLSPAIPIWIAVPAVIAVTIAALAGLRRGALPPLLVLAAASAAVVVVAFVVYPRADALRDVMRGTDQDDAVIAVATGLSRGEYPFATPTYLGNPVSPGALWGLAHLPFAATGTYILVPVFALVACVAILVTRGGTRAGATMLIVLGSAPVFWEALTIGSDQFTVGCLAVVLVILIHGAAEKELWGAAVLGTIIATARVVYPYLPALAGLLAARSARARGAALIASVAGALIHLAFYLWRPAGYGPVNALQRADTSLPGAWRYLAVVSTLAVVVSAWRYGRTTLEDQLYWFGWCLAVPLGWMLLGRAAEQGLWIATYVVPALVPLAAGAALTERDPNSWSKPVPKTKFEKQTP